MVLRISAVLSKDTDAKVRTFAADALAREPITVEPLIALLKDGNVYTRQIALEAYENAQFWAAVKPAEPVNPPAPPSSGDF
jgi:hypothetical protein